ncbi:MAG: phage major capsid protein [Solidesulfovibrio sp. DCME]|uniref:phage major capsid protein n=1 Tax=Solidesulfovibrio sp. DCME TaxID=3447380 RepID=UPI003D0DC267
MEAEIKSLIEQQGKAFMDFKSRTDTEIKELGAALDEIAKKQNRPPAAGGSFHATHESKAALGRYVRTGDLPDTERKAWTEASDSAGVLVPEQIASAVMAVAKKYSPMREVCKVIQIQTTASKFTQPIIVDGSPSGWVGEVDDRPNTAAPSIEGITFPDAECYCNIPLSTWVDEDSQAADLVIQEIGKSFGRSEGSAFITGDGSKKPIGFLHGTPSADDDDTRAFGTLQYLLSGSATGLTSDALISLVYSLKPEYRMNGVWVMNASTIAAVRKLKNTSGDYIWSDSIAPGQPAMLLGYRVLEAANMPDIEAGALPIAFGDFASGYTILDRSMAMLRDPYSVKQYVQIYARKRVSGNVTDSCAIKLLKVGTA